MMLLSGRELYNNLLICLAVITIGSTSSHALDAKGVLVLYNNASDEGRQIADYYASCANPFQSKLMPWPGRIVANADWFAQPTVGPLLSRTTGLTRRERSPHPIPPSRFMRERIARAWRRSRASYAARVQRR